MGAARSVIRTTTDADVRAESFEFLGVGAGRDATLAR